MYPGLDYRRTRRSDLSYYDEANLYTFTDHEERVPLFIKTSESDPELPYGPLLRYVTISPRFSIIQPSH